MSLPPRAQLLLNPRDTLEVPETWTGLESRGTGYSCSGGSRLHGGGQHFHKVWFSCPGFKLLPLFTHSNLLSRFLQAFLRVCQGHSYLHLFTTHQHTSFSVLHVVGKGLVGWGNLVFFFVLNCFVQKFCFFPTSCLQGFEMRAQNHME